MDGNIIIGTKIDTSGMDEGLDDIEKKVDKSFLNKFTDMLAGIVSKVSGVSKEISNSLGKAMRTAVKWVKEFSENMSGIGMAISAISLLGIIGAIGLASAKSEEARLQLEQIQTIVVNLVNTLAELLLPIAEEIVNFIYKAVMYVGVLLEQWFGIDLFTSNVSDSLNNGVKSAKALKKQLMGFDEMNILNKDTGTTGAIGGLGGSKTGGKPKQSPKEAAKEFAQDVERVVDETNHDIAARTGNNVRNWILENIPGAKFIDENLVSPVRNLLYKTGWFEPVEPQVIEFTDTMLQEYQHLASQTDDMSKKMVESFQDEFRQAKVIAKDGMLEITLNNGNILKMTEEQYIDTIKSFGLVSKNMTKEDAKAYLNRITLFKKGSKEEKKVTQESKKSWVDVFNTITKTYPEVAQAILDGNYKIKKDYVEVKTKSGEVVKYSIDEFKKLQRQLTDVGTEGANSSTKTKTGWVGSMNSIISKALGKDQNGLLGAFTETFNEINNSSNKDSNETKKSWIDTANELIKKYTDKSENGVSGSIKSAFNDLPEETKTNIQSAMKTATDLINKFNPPKKKITFGADITDAKNKVIKLLEKAGTTGLFGKVNQTLINQIKNLAKGGIINPPRLAVGGIINRPGSGVPIAVGGERGREAIVPLTDSQQMAYLGREIAKNVVISLTNVTELDGRQLARSVTQVMNDMNFASNGGVI